MNTCGECEEKLREKTESTSIYSYTGAKNYNTNKDVNIRPINFTP